MSDALATLRAALAPHGGMRRIPLPTESYQHPSPPLSSKRLLNWMAEAQPADARAPFALVPTPGLIVYDTWGDGPIKAMNSDNPGTIYSVSGTHVFRWVGAIGGPTVTDLGSVGTPDTSVLMWPRVTIAAGPTAAVICVPPKVYVCSHSGALNEITTMSPGGADPFPGAAWVTYLDGYWIFGAYENSGKFFLSRLMDPATYDALDFAFSDGVPNVIWGGLAHRGELWLMGWGGNEVWYDAGAADFPLRRQSGGVIAEGIATPLAVAEGDGSVWWIGEDGVVFRSDGYLPRRISTHAVEAAIAQASPNTATCGIFHRWRGHSIFSFTLGTATFAYDASVDKWHHRSSSTTGEAAWFPTSACKFPPIVLFGDSLSGNVYTLGDAESGDDGIGVLREAILPPVWAATKRAFCSRAEIECQVGDGADDLTLDWSDDGGFNWSASRDLPTGAAGALETRVATTRLGSFRQRVFRVRTHSAHTLYAFDADIDVRQTGGAG